MMRNETIKQIEVLIVLVYNLQPFAICYLFIFFIDLFASFFLDDWQILMFRKGVWAKCFISENITRRAIL